MILQCSQRKYKIFDKHKLLFVPTANILSQLNPFALHSPKYKQKLQENRILLSAFAIVEAFILVDLRYR